MINEIVPKSLMDANTKIHVNPTGRFVVRRSLQADTGLNGRKILVDTYGGSRPARRRSLLRQGPHEGRPLRRILRPLRRQEHSSGGPGGPRREYIVSYAIGVAAAPLHLRGDFWHQPRGRRHRSSSWYREATSIFAAAAIIRRPQPSPPHLQATRPAYGHFGQGPTLQLPWERTDKADLLRRKAGVCFLP